MGFKDYRKFSKKEEQNQEPEVIQNNEEVTEIKALTDCTIEELVEVAVKEDVAFKNSEMTKEELIAAIEAHRSLGDVTVLENTDEVELKAEVTTKGVVTANKLNIRKEANKGAEVLTVVSKGVGLGVNLTKSTDEFYCVNVMFDSEMTTGYAMKEFIDIE